VNEEVNLDKTKEMNLEVDCKETYDKMRMRRFVDVDVRTCKMRMLMRRLETILDRLGSGPIVGRLRSGVQVSASFQVFPLRMLLHSDIRINIRILHVRTFGVFEYSHVRKSAHPRYTPAFRNRGNARVN